MARTRCYCAGVLSDENFELADVSEHLDEPDSIVWIDLCAPEIDELRVVAGELGLHELAVEDAVQGRQRPKIDRYPDHSFLSTYATSFDPVTAELAMSEVAAFLTPHALVTVRRDETFDIEAVVERWDSHADLAQYGVAFLVHGLLDFVVDGHFAAVQGDVAHLAGEQPGADRQRCDQRGSEHGRPDEEGHDASVGGGACP